MKEVVIQFRIDKEMAGGECDCGWRGIVFTVFNEEFDDCCKSYPLNHKAIYCPMCGKRERGERE